MRRCDICNFKLTHIESLHDGWVGLYQCPICHSKYEITNLGQGYEDTKTMVKRGPHVSIIDDPRYKSLPSKGPYRLKMVYIPTFREKFQYFLKKVAKKFGW